MYFDDFIVVTLIFTLLRLVFSVLDRLSAREEEGRFPDISVNAVGIFRVNKFGGYRWAFI